MSDASSLVIDVDTSLFCLSAIKKAAYKFGDRCHIQLGASEGGRISVTLKPKRASDNLEFLAGEFHNEVLDQDLREIVAQETEGIRNLLLARIIHGHL